MSKLVWDQTGERYYENGTSKGVLYPMSNGTYEDGVAWNGLTSVSLSPDGAEAQDLYADNIKYATFRSAETFGGTIEAYTYPDEWAACDGSATPTPGLYLGQQKRKPFGLCFRSEIGDDTHDFETGGYKLHLIYNSTASPSERSYETINDSPDAITLSWEFESTPVNVANTDYKPVAHIEIDSNKVDATKLGTLEDILYGTTQKEPRLPLPAEVLSTLS